MRGLGGAVALVVGGVTLLAACGSPVADVDGFEPGTAIDESVVAEPEVTTTPNVSPAPSTTTTLSVAEAPDPPTGYPAPTAGVDRWIPSVLDTLPHDSAAFTQGLVVRGDVLYESTGLYGRSTVRLVDRGTGEVLASESLPEELFGEGLELVDGRLVQLTWQSEQALVWDASTLDRVGTLTYTGEGWGLCDGGQTLVMSDGTSELTFRDRATFAEIGTVEVTLEGEPVVNLNELECVGGFVFANVWKSADIIVVEPGSGEVTALIDASELVALAGADDAGAVLNGIAYDAERGVFLVTGKLWDVVFEVAFVDG